VTKISPGIYISLTQQTETVIEVNHIFRIRWKTFQRFVSVINLLVLQLAHRWSNIGIYNVRLKQPKCAIFRID